MINKNLLIFSLAACFCCFSSCNEDKYSCPEIALVPDHDFTMPETAEVVSFQSINGGAELGELAGSHYVLRWLSNDSGIPLELAVNDDFDTEEFELSVQKSKIQITSSTYNGWLRGLSTICQIIEEVDDGYILPIINIKDAPEYEYRGMMLDIARNFFTASEIESLLPYLWFFKINYLHLHLSDDQGWRIEIPSYPKLADIGGDNSISGKRSGYLTVSDFKALQNKALAFGITIVPEIDLPGHTNALLVAYPEFAPEGVNPQPYSGMAVGFSSLKFENPDLLPFIKTVTSELADMTIGPYIHLGGDEAHKTSTADYAHFMTEVSSHVNSLGKTVIGWEEIAKAKLPFSHVAQIWNARTMRQAKKNDSQIILSPAEYTYLDMKYNSSTQLGLDWAGLISFNKSASWDPATYGATFKPENILGIEYPLWSETLTSMDDLYYMAFPRICSAAEIGWNGAIKESVTDFADNVELLFEKSQLNYQNICKIHWK